MLAHYGFIVTLLWIGFVLALSFLEAPLKFQAPSVTTPIGLEIGHLVFHALNRIEWLFTILIGVSLYFVVPSNRIIFVALVILMILIVQTVLLFGPLDTRTLAIINGETVPEAAYHLYYIAFEVIKLLTLAYFTYLQIQAFQQAVLLNG